MAKIITNTVSGKEIKVLVGLDFSEKMKIKMTHTYEIPEGVNIIASEVFMGNKNLQIVTAPASLTKIEKNAFASCSNLQMFIGKMSRESKVVETSAFRDCSKLRRVQFYNVREIGDYAFSNTAITGEGFDIDFSNVQKLGVGTFENCKSLKIINMPFVRVLPEGCFKNCVNLDSFTTGRIVKEGRFALQNTKFATKNFEEELQY